MAYDAMLMLMLYAHDLVAQLYLVSFVATMTVNLYLWCPANQGCMCCLRIQNPGVSL
jgi:hypothetical protein